MIGYGSDCGKFWPGGLGILPVWFLGGEPRVRGRFVL